MTEPLSSFLATKAAEEASKGLIQTLSGASKTLYKKIEFQVAKGFPQYLRTQSIKCESSKTLLSRDNNVFLPDTYVEPEFEFLSSIVSGKDILKWPTKSSAGILVTGLAGCGKSAYLRMSFLNSIQEGVTFYPLFFELRRLNSEEFKDRTLLEALTLDISKSVPSFDTELLRFGLERGAFYFFLDGYDELNYDIRDRVSDEIEELAAVFSDCSFMMTSRPSEDLDSWASFEACKLQPFSKEKVKEFVTKTPFENDEKCKFLEEIDVDLFDQHAEFLSNPLLALMMLLIFSSRGEIPKKKHLFYEKCFEILTIEHDARKGRYKRKLFSDIEMDDLERIFKFFCVLSYRKRAFTFEKEEALKFCASAIKTANLSSAPDKRMVLRDFQESISILAREGEQYDFAHRSFQEYFYAKFVVDDRTLEPAKKLDRAFGLFSMDDVFDMARDINPAYVEDHFLIPEYKSLIDKLSKFDLDQKPDMILRPLIKEFSVHSPEDNSPELVFRVDGTMNEFQMWRFAAKELEVKRKLEVDNIEKFESDFPAGIKVHHTNRHALIELGAGKMAKLIMTTLKDFLAVLEERREQRRDPVLEAFKD